MITRLTGGRIVDPVHGEDGVVRDVIVRDGRIVTDHGDGEERRIKLDGAIVMAGGVDIHSHVAGGKVNLSRLLMTADHRAVKISIWTEARLRPGQRWTTILE